MTVPLRGGQPTTPAEFAQLSEPVRARYQTALEELGPRTQAFLTEMRALRREGRERLRALEREVALFAVGHLIDELKQRYADSAKVAHWLDTVAEDVTENRGQFQAPDRDGGVTQPNRWFASRVRDRTTKLWLVARCQPAAAGVTRRDRLAVRVLIT
jgi:hypothetical protein